MRKAIMICLHDDFAEKWTPPICLGNKNLAIRFFEEAPEHDEIIKAHPEDWSLWEVGEFDEEEGQVTGLKCPKLIKRGAGRGENTIQNETEQG